jgi:Yip1 domain
MNNLQMIVALATAPRKAFDELAQKPRWLFPFLLVLGSTLLLTIWYYSKVDISWLIDEQLRNNPRAAALTEEQRAQVTSRMNPAVVMWSSIIAVCVVLVLVRVLEATWYTLAGKVTNVDRSFKQWFALANWTSLPSVIAVIPAAIALLMASGTQIDPGTLQPLSLNELFFHLKSGDTGYQLLSNLSLLSLIGALLAVIGVKAWSGRSWLFASVFVLLPLVVIGGVAALLMFR